MKTMRIIAGAGLLCGVVLAGAQAQDKPMAPIGDKPMMEKPMAEKAMDKKMDKPMAEKPMDKPMMDKPAAK